MQTLTYTRLTKLVGYYDRLNYLIQNGRVFDETFGGLRHLNQVFYNSREWKRVRDFVIMRDQGLDLGVPDMEILGVIYVHHMNPITPTTLKRTPEYALSPEYLISTSRETHHKIHFGIQEVIELESKERCPGDTDLW